MILLAVALFCWTSCSDRDDNGEDIETDNRTAANVEMTAGQIADYATENFISHVCQVEVDTVTLRLKSWKLNYGQVLYPETPYVRYVRAESQQAARREFLSMICSEATIDSSSVTAVLTVEMGNHGSVKFIPNLQNGEWARIEVNLKELPECQEIVFCKPNAWPENFPDCGVELKTLFERQEGGRTMCYVCVDKCSSTGTGYLIGFDTWTNVNTSFCHGYRGRRCYHAWWWMQPGGMHVIDCLRGFLFDDTNGKRNRKAEKIIREIYKRQGGNPNNTVLCGEDALYNFLYSDGKLAGRKPYFKTGDDVAYQDTHDNIWGTWHYIRVPYTVLEPSRTYCSKIAYECDEIDPNTHNKENTHTRNVEQPYDKWGVAWCCFQFGAEWIWKIGEWYSFQQPRVIEFHYYDGKDLQEFASHYGFSVVNVPF
jgi:hypothetical protein